MTLAYLLDKVAGGFDGGFLSKDAFKKFFMSLAVDMFSEAGGDFTLSVEESAGETGKGKGRSRGDRTWVTPTDCTLGVEVRYKPETEDVLRAAGAAPLSEESTLLLVLDCLLPSSSLERLGEGSYSGVGLYSGMFGGGK